VLAVTGHGVEPEDGPVLVTGAGGGVGGVAVALLAASGYTVEASTGKTAESGYLKGLGASELIDRTELSEPGKPLAKQRWAAAVDTVGGQTLANVCASMNYGGIVAACGNAGGMDVPANVAPFILRAVTLAGIDSVSVPMSERAEIWQQLAEAIDPDVLDTLTEDVGLTDVVDAAQRLLAGEVRGRLVVDTSR
jgi:acrylyl-CoA reductase (NADPH)